VVKQRVWLLVMSSASGKKLNNMTDIQLALIVSDILQYLVENAAELSKTKFSGVHDPCDEYYSIHKSDFIPNICNIRNITNDLILLVIETSFKDKMEYNKLDLWLRIYK